MKTTGARRATAVAALALGLGLSACGGSSSTSSTTAATSTATSTSSSSAAAPAATASGAPGSSATPAASAEPSQSVVTTPVPAPGGGDIHQTVAPSAVPTPAAKPITATATPTAGVQVSIKTSTAKLAAKVPGDVSGAGVLVTVTIHNTTSKPVPAGDTVVSLTDSTGAPASMFVGPPAKPIHGDLAAGATSSGVYAFRLDAAKAGKVRITVQGDPTMGVAVYEGSAKG